MSVARKKLLVVIGAVLAGSLVWLVLAWDAAGAEVAYRTRLAADGERSTARVIEEGVARDDGAYAGAWVETPAGTRAFVDLTNSRLSISRLGEELAVVLPPPDTGRDVALPVDVVEASHSAVYRDRLTGPALLSLTAGVAAGVAWRLSRRLDATSNRRG